MGQALAQAAVHAEIRQHLDELGPDVALMLSSLARFRPDEYLDAQRLRATLRR